MGRIQKFVWETIFSTKKNKGCLCYKCINSQKNYLTLLTWLTFSGKFLVELFRWFLVVDTCLASGSSTLHVCSHRMIWNEKVWLVWSILNFAGEPHFATVNRSGIGDCGDTISRIQYLFVGTSFGKAQWQTTNQSERGSWNLELMVVNFKYSLRYFPEGPTNNNV